MVEARDAAEILNQALPYIQRFQGQTFVELIEDTYVAFRRAIDLMVVNTTCECNACRNIV